MFDSRAVLVGTCTCIQGLPQLDQAAANLTDLSDALTEIVDPSGMHTVTYPTAAHLALDPLDRCASSRRTCCCSTTPDTACATRMTACAWPCPVRWTPHGTPAAAPCPWTLYWRS
ncbi:hypothetical protein [Amycolatopsis coloradensis]|uniref:hypothetical protein n=1 Tax=Amycolatopsis coloradensis TaxID=76021 RepID=UPI00117742AC|nr:hypothetical protein [Amycolatopsis coloradensis]